MKKALKKTLALLMATASLTVSLGGDERTRRKHRGY